MKNPRFLLEFASYAKKQYIHNELMQQKYRDYAIKKIDTALTLCERGMLTTSEAIDTINHPFPDGDLSALC